MNFSSAQIPLARLILPLVSGIAFAYSFRFTFSFPVFLLLILPLLFFLIAQKKLLQRSLNWAGFDGLLIMLALFVSGILLTGFQLDGIKKINPAKGNQQIVLHLLNDPVVKERSVKCSAEISGIKDSSGNWAVSEEKIMVYLVRGPAAEKLKYGDQLIVSAEPKFIEGPKNPNEFDYRAWLERQGVYRQCFVKTENWKLHSQGNGNFFKTAALDLRRYFMKQLRASGVSGEEYGVAAALLLGASDHLDPGLLQAYSASGTMHVLSVSGMHVALVYLVLLRLLAPLENRKRGRWISLLIQLFFIWFYASLTGLCPSVLRAVTMLTVIIFGKAFNRQAHILNSLAASALILLLINPLLLFDIGFQLSYLAVAGIVLLQPMLEKKWQPKIWILRQGWTLLTVTIVAQVFTFPLGLYYFRQFPTYFLLSNLFVIPLSTLAMYAGLALLLVSPFSLISKIVALVFVFLIQMLNTSVRIIEELPYSSAHTSGWSKDELFLLYFVLLGLIIFLSKKRPLSLQIGLLSFFLLMLSTACKQREELSENKIVFFSLNRGTAIGILSGQKHLLLTDTALARSFGDIDFHINPFFESRGLYDQQLRFLTDTLQLKTDLAHAEKSWLKAAGKSIFIADRNTVSPFAQGPCDILFMRSNTKLKLDSLLFRLHPDIVIADGSSGKKKTGKWKTICAEKKIPFYDVKEQGALVIEQKN